MLGPRFAPQRVVRFRAAAVGLVVLGLALAACDRAPSSTATGSGGRGVGGPPGSGGSAAGDAAAATGAGGADIDVGGNGSSAGGGGNPSNDPTFDARMDQPTVVPPDAASDGTPPPGCPVLPGGATFSDAATLKSTGFTDGTIAPYTVCTTQNPAYGQPFALDGAPSMKFFWTQVGYDGTRQDRGAEACSALAVYKEGWYGFKFYLPTPGFPTDKTQAIAQIFANGGCSSWAALLEVRNNALWIVYRANCVATPEYEVMLASDVPRNVWNPIVLHFIASSQNAGGIEIWYGGAVCARDSPTYRNLGINFAFGTWTGDTLTADPANSIGFKFGMYNFDDGNYTTGETRTIYYDDVTELDGAPANAFTTVNPGR